MDYRSIFLFQGLTEADIAQMEHDRCLRRKAFARRQTIFHTGDTVHEIGIVLRGAVHTRASTSGAAKASSARWVRGRPLPRPMRSAGSR